MKLRNKKTGEIVEREEFILIKHIEGDGGWQDGSYHSIAELNEDWEDYKSVEPRIEDPKARKIFREWAELFGAERFRVVHHGNFGKGETTSIWSTDITTEPGIELSGHIGKDSEIYSITELCGEEEECES
jgi:hypothetical protein